MHKACGYTVNNLRLDNGKKCIQMSTIFMYLVLCIKRMWVKRQVLHRIILPTNLVLSTHNFRLLSLKNYQLYPLSTAPIITNAN